MTGAGEQAEPHHRRAVALAPDNPAYLNNLGFSLFLRHKNKEAIEVYQQAVRLSPTSGRIRAIRERTKRGEVARLVQDGFGDRITLSLSNTYS